MKKQSFRTQRSHPPMRRPNCAKRVTSWVSPAARLALALALLMNGPASRVSSFNQQVFGQTTATTAAKAGWGFTNSMHTRRYGHTATRLENGKVLIAGGGGWPCFGGVPCSPEEGYATVNRSSELYDPIKGIWSVTGELTERRSDHTATLLEDGRFSLRGARIGALISADSAISIAQSCTTRLQESGASQRASTGLPGINSRLRCLQMERF